MDHLSKSRQEGDTDKMPPPTMSITPLPHTGAALFEAFHTYKPAAPFKPVADDPSFKYLTWSFLQNDPLCQELSELLPLIGTIFAYSSRKHDNDLSDEELAAGFRYFIPTGNLAREWIQFFELAPDRFQMMAPPDVLYAYRRERDWDTCSMRKWIQAGVDAWKVIRARETAVKQSSSKPQLQVSGLKRKEPYAAGEDGSPAETQLGHSFAPPMDMFDPLQPVVPYDNHLAIDPSISTSYHNAGVCDNRGKHAAEFYPNIPVPTEDSHVFVPDFTTLGHKRQRRGDEQAGANSSSTWPVLHPEVQYGGAHPQVDPSFLPGPEHVAPIDPILLAGLHVQTVSPRGASTASDARVPTLANVNQTLDGAVPAHLTSAVAPSHASIASSAAANFFATSTPNAPILGQGYINQTAATHHQASAGQQAQSSQQVVQHATAAPIISVPQLQTQNANAAPRGSQTHRGKGFFQRGWSDDRIRAFTEIEGKSMAELPSAAHSPWGDEMSRNHTPKSVDPRLCPFETTMEENLTYFTLATTANRQMCSRAKASWTAQECIHYVYWAHDLRDEHSYGRTTVQKQYTKCKEFETANKGLPHTAAMSTLRTDSNLSGADATTHDFFLHAMGKNVVNHPEGKGEHILTRVIKHVLGTGNEKVRLSDAARYATLHGIWAPTTNARLSAIPVTNDGPDENSTALARAEYVVKFGKPA